LFWNLKDWHISKGYHSNI